MITQEQAWEDVAESLRLLYLRCNSQIPNIQVWIDERVVETLDKIRTTAQSRKTKTLIENIPRTL